MRVFDTDLFREYGQAASIGYGRRPGHRENAVILDRELNLKPLASVVGIDDQPVSTGSVRMLL